ncbi:hypothetical protein [Streptomyces sp. NE06-03C]|uniref:hypothetical protein n=1 Tax=Streptomyces sp. NE06-03C TaxID=3028694 RepID=UPI0029ADDB09|nr:hypothetical protein [Streptomyces sp. NE06-03C]MDX2922474.1 hypothetical protein [Streptomyces sp. NE06-03C]
MSDTTDEETPDTEPETPAFRVRDVFQFRRQPKQDAEPEPEEKTAEDRAVPPKPTDAPIVIPQTTKEPAGLRIGERPRNWWEPKPIITPDERDPRDTIVWRNGRPYDVPAPPPKMCDHPDPHAVRSRPDNRLVAFWCADCETQLPVPDDYDELLDVAKVDDDQDDGDEAGGEGEVPAHVRKRWAPRGDGEKTYRRPVYAKDTAARKQSLVEAFTGLSPKTKHLLYNGTALGAGLYVGVPQFFTAEVAYLAATYDSWTDFYVVVWYGVAVGILVLDFRTRSWFPLIAWAARIPLVSMIVGALYYGTPAA